MSVRRRIAGLAVVPLLVGGCTALAAPSDPPLRPLPDAAPGELITVFTVDDADRESDNFDIWSAVALPDGTALISWDPSAEQAGDDHPGSQPQLSLLGADGGIRPVESSAEGEAAGLHRARPLGGGPDGTVYFRGPSSHLVARSADGVWSTVPGDLDFSAALQPVLAVGPQGTLLVTDASGLVRVHPHGRVESVVRVDGSTGSDDPSAPPLPADFTPRPAAEVALSSVYGLAVRDDGTVFVATRTEIVAIDPSGVLRLVTTGQGLNDSLGIVNELDPTNLWWSLAIDTDGSLLAGDAYYQLVVDLEGPEVIAEHIALPPGGPHTSWSPHDDLLVIELDPDALEAGPSDPDRLAVLGR